MKEKNSEILFEKMTKNIRSYLKSDVRYNESFLPRPFMIEFTGSPSAGKTTTIIEMDKFLRRQGFRVLCPQEGAQVVRHIERTSPLYNICTGLYALRILIDESHGHLYDVILFDRCIFDAYCWMMYWEEKGWSKTDMEMVKSFFLSKHWQDKIDISYFMVCDSDVAMKREERIAATKKLGETTNPETIKKLVSRYKKAYEILKPDNPQLHLLDTTYMKEKEMVKKFSIEILSILDQKAKDNSKK